MTKLRAALIPPVAWVILLVVACLVPFVKKAFHIDDPLFLWTAEHIRIAPGDFYDFRVNWHGLEMPMTDAECNPPLMGFLLALASLVVGWGEAPLHLVAMLPAIAVALGTFRLAQSYSSRPLLAAALLVLTPGFLVCSNSVMCDVTMLAFWVWAIVFWERGFATHRFADFVWAGVLAGLCGLTKYSGLSVVPLLLAYALARHWQAKRSPAGMPALPGRWALALLIPIAMLVVYEWVAYRRYGVVLLENATAYAREVRTGTLAGLPERVVSGLVFAGGCGLPALLLAPCLWSRRALGIGAALFAGINGAALRHGWLSFASNWPLELQRAFFLLGGVSIVVLAIGDLRKNRDAISVLLALWVGGVLLFATVFNWTLNGRTVLPMLPAVGVLIARRLQSAPKAELHTESPHPGPLPFGRGEGEGAPPNAAVLGIGLGLAALVALGVTAADYRLANTGREAARLLTAKYPAPETHLVFQGHWGFQYYLQKKGREPLDVWKGAVGPSDLVAIPAYDIHELPPEASQLLEVVELRSTRQLATLERFIGAGFHSDFLGPLPFALGRVETERYYVFKVLRPLSFSNGDAFLVPTDAGQDQAKLAQCEAALRLNGNDADKHFEAGVLLMRQARLPEAISHLGEVLRLRPADIQANALLGSLYQAQGKPREVREQYYTALARMPDFLSVLNNLAWLLATDTDPAVRNGKEAVRLAERACALTLRLRPLFLGTLSAAYAESGRFEDAIAAAEKARDLAARAGQREVAARNEHLLALYRAGKPYREGER